ncbi:hypothetical protein OC846_005675 [Tilletia horrida]|uniref:Uncharacterized protein n=1 Tax=Tilletia horrida TaxID=155126 RepID=A0AAN6GK28_9BASI|nr:hypothetical protein OC845_005245 [Tilletia horrida]KAK0545433.1 hypothetical protein OC846_005675 [Tilletia horrida]KAK0568699.1 hypothetical protein OC861_001701 [Tilletia horrida]
MASSSSSSKTSTRSPIGMGRPSAASRFDSLQDLLVQAGYKETRIYTPNNNNNHNGPTALKQPHLRKRASRTSHALWTASLSAHSSSASSASSSSTSAAAVKRRPSLPQAFFTGPLTTRTSSTGADAKLMANVALPILSAAPAVAPLPTPPLPPSEFSKATSLDQSQQQQQQQQGADGEPHHLGRMRSVDLLRDTLDQIQHFQLVVSTPPHSLSASTSSSSSHNSSFGKLIRTSVIDSPSLSQSASLPKLYLSSPRGLSEPQQITLESIPDPPPPSPDPSQGHTGLASPGLAAGLGLAMLNFFGLGSPAASPSRSPSSSASSPTAALATTPATHTVRSPGMISSESIEAELDKILAGQRRCHSPASPKKKRHQLQRTGTDPSSAWLPYQMERRPTSASLEVINPVKTRNGKKRRSVSSSSPGPSSTTDNAENRLRRVSSASSSSTSSSSSSGSSGMSLSQLDRIGAALRGGAGALGRARSVSALRTDIEMSRAAREGHLPSSETDQRASGTTARTTSAATDDNAAAQPVKTVLGEAQAVPQSERPSRKGNTNVRDDDPFICSQADAPSKVAILSQYTLVPSTSLISAIADESHTDSMRRKVSPLSSITLSGGHAGAQSKGNDDSTPTAAAAAAGLKSRNLNSVSRSRTMTSPGSPPPPPTDENAKPSMIPIRSRASILNISHRDVRRGRQASHPQSTAS